MNIDTQSVDQAVTAMAEVLADYLHPEEVRLLKSQWQRYSTVSVKMMQQCVLDATRRYPELQACKSDIRKGFWATLQADSQQTVESDSHNSHNETVKAPVPVSELVLAFYTVIEALRSQLSETESRNLFLTMHQTVSQERTFKGHSLNISQFLEGNRPSVPDNEHLLNNLMQLAYICLCDVAGPVEADEMMFRAAETAKQSYPKTLVEKLF
ncbi:MULTISPECIES: hypothetical protein [Psychrobacter]|jgi:hypothetical protein|uniref:hypothetical protein n=1 Tax=Psychrobacter TaxID=497 RepID=UPI000C33CFE5|nr:MULTISPECIES: hypothetical protein [Psychrobacter]MBA6243336.1 hypothetical protein [Psychrobacter sp. Urea-trap-18]MBA6286939.1 hypothetical protein [Psychrobacter sp. Urea-trap-16]MBA6317988.1 hypothetical protein [Psychrobacter sp. Urea-trap-20]MBA6333486.1 hypothetical protein [Psychrobacter sp. Urea-trap-19]PKG61886.1 hypothetical protein CXF63_00390 [Psychrobacter sp. Choline-3u-12]